MAKCFDHFQAILSSIIPLNSAYENGSFGWLKVPFLNGTKKKNQKNAKKVKQFLRTHTVYRELLGLFPSNLVCRVMYVYGGLKM